MTGTNAGGLHYAGDSWKGPAVGSIISITGGPVEDFKSLHARVVDLDGQTETLVSELRRLHERLTGKADGGENKPLAGERPTEVVLNDVANNVSLALRLATELRCRLYGE